ncbi:uncharacterized protein LOC134275394 [Saccostrea cucullata]|uniref:uncharacterized protein LOC134275394 n=1 Tax=Saccostrea cuccullata TaxID=36930 RepID=UPI002ED63750
MANTKITKAKENKCPLCDGEVDGNRWREHLLACNGGRYPCKVCGKLFKKRLYLIRHKRKFHEQTEHQQKADEKVKVSEEKKDEEDESWLEQDPGDVIHETLSVSESSSQSGDSSSEDDDGDKGAGKLMNNSCIGDHDETKPDSQDVKSVNEEASVDIKVKSPEKGRVVRKATAPAPVFEPKRRTPVSLPEKPTPLGRFSFGSTSTCTRATQTNCGCKDRYVKKRKVHKVVSTYTKDQKNIVETVEEEEFFYLE